MNPEAILTLISDLYSQVREAQEACALLATRNAELGAEQTNADCVALLEKTLGFLGGMIDVGYPDSGEQSDELKTLIAAIEVAVART